MKVQNEPSKTISKKYLLNKLLEDIRDNTYSYRTKLEDRECKEAVSIVNALFGRLDYCNLVVEWGKVMDMEIDTDNNLLKELSLEIQSNQVEQIMKDVPLHISHGEFYPAIQVSVSKELRADLLIELSNVNEQAFEYLFETFIAEYSSKLQKFEVINFTPGIEQLNKQFDGQVKLIVEELNKLDVSKLVKSIKNDLKEIAEKNFKQINGFKVGDKPTNCNTKDDSLSKSKYKKNEIEM